MLKIWIALMVFVALGLVSCAPQRWADGDPRQATPEPGAVEIIETVEVDLSTAADSPGNTLPAQ